MTAKNAKGATVAFVVLTPEQSREFYRAPFGGRERAILSKATVLADGNDLRLLSDHAPDFQIALFPPMASVKAGAASVKGTKDGIFARFSLKVAQPADVEVTAKLEKPAGPKAATMKGTDEASWADAAVYQLNIPAAAAGRNLRLDVNYIGDAARFYVGDKLVLDNFYNGDPSALPLWRIPAADWSKITLKVLPYSEELAKRLPPDARKTASAAAAAGTLDKVTITAIEPLEARISPN